MSKQATKERRVKDTAPIPEPSGGAAVPRRSLGKRILQSWQLYAMPLIPVVITIIYKYIPMYGIQIAFRDYKAQKGFFGSKWVGMTARPDRVVKMYKKPFPWRRNNTERGLFWQIPALEY